MNVDLYYIYKKEKNIVAGGVTRNWILLLGQMYCPNNLLKKIQKVLLHKIDEIFHSEILKLIKSSMTDHKGICKTMSNSGELECAFFSSGVLGESD